MEVRCCCNPENLLGWLPEHSLGEIVYYLTKDKHVKVPIRVYVEELDDGIVQRTRAYSSHGLSVEDLKAIEGFEEVGSRPKPKRPSKRPKKRTWEK